MFFLETLWNYFQNYPLILALCSLGMVWIGWELVKWILKYREFVRIFNQIPGLPYFGFPYLCAVLGNIDGFIYFMWHMPRSKAAMTLLEGLSKIDEHRPTGLFRIIFGWHRIVLFYSQKSIEPLITSSVNIKKSNQYFFFKKWLGRGLLTSDGEQWRRNRKLLTPAFHFKILESFVPIMNEDIGKLVEKIERMIDENPKEMREKGVDVRPLVTRCTLDTICSTAMGVSIHSQDEYNNKYVQSLKIVLEKIFLRSLEPLYHVELLFQLSPDGWASARSVRRIHNFVKSVIKDRKQEVEKSIQENKIDLATLASDDVGFLFRKRYAFLDSLLLTHLRTPKEFTMENVLDEVNTFMFEGHDTTSTSMFFSLILIANDQRVQAKIHDEMDSVFGSDQQRPITSEDCRSMKYLEMCIKESLRLFPSVPIIGRQVTEEFNVDQKYQVPVGSIAVILISTLHRNPEVFKNPELFIPERFEPGQPIHKMPYAYIPFAAGPRNCIGQKFAMMEMKILLASIFRRFQLFSKVLIDELDIDTNLILQSNTPIMIHFERRA